MFDNLRDDAAATPFYEEETKFQPAGGTSSSSSGSRSRRILGMTAAQRFVIAVMLMITVCVLGAMLLLVTGKVAL